ncbi:unnamed protein product [Cylindrotheca closterium]|uniref:DUF1810 domain-containing protein n=1 Tax=Cylindrotheca closterium TaxID=2856 RepID=A0AAD2G8V3_9STRA|nr:unnamed protein product [Cylindrotheca closterium]
MRRKRTSDSDDSLSNNSSSNSSASQSGKNSQNSNPGDSSVSKDHQQSDPHDLIERFVMNQKARFPHAIAEIKQGKKRTHWLWFILPTPPYIVDGKERGSEMNRYFALRGDAPQAYLKVDALRYNYLEICRAMECQLKFGNTFRNMFGPYDCPKVISSLNMFNETALQMKDDELATVCSSLLSMDKKKNPNSTKR